MKRFHLLTLTFLIGLFSCDHLSPKRPNWKSYQLAKKAFEIEDYEKAILHCDNEIKNNPNAHFSYGLKGRCLQSIHNYKAAIAPLSKAIHLKNNEYNYYFWRANCYKRLDSLKLALSDYERILTIEHKLSKVIGNYNIGLIKLDQQDTLSACDYLKRAKRFNRALAKYELCCTKSDEHYFFTGKTKPDKR